MVLRSISRASVAATLLAVLFFSAGAAFAADSASPAAPTDIANRRQFWFNAQDLVAESNLIRILQQRPQKYANNPVMVADKPWETTLIQLYSCDVHYDPKTSQWQMWYEGHPGEVLLCTAFSKDGIHWTKPSLGIEEWRGSRDNNIILQTGYWDANCASIVKAPNETDPAKRFKLYYWVGAALFFKENLQVQDMGGKLMVKEEYRKQDGHYVAFSEDGIHFKPHFDHPAVFPSGDFNTTFFDEQTGKYRSYHTAWTKQPGWDSTRRCLATYESDDGIHFETNNMTRLVLVPDKIDDEDTRAQGGIRAEYYGMHAWPHQGFYLGLLWVFRVTNTNSPHGRGWDDGRVEPYLMYSADGYDWKRLPVREPFISHGAAGSFEAGTIFSAGDRPVTVGDELRFYYTGVSYTHGCTDPKTSPNNLSGVGFATLKRDRYVAWQAGAVPGSLLTKPMTFTGSQLHLNLDASRGETRVALLDAEGNPLPGFSLEDCEPISSDGLDQIVKWRSGSDVSALAGKPVRLQFSMRHSALYTWQFN